MISYPLTEQQEKLFSVVLDHADRIEQDLGTPEADALMSTLDALNDAVQFGLAQDVIDAGFRNAWHAFSRWEAASK